VRKLKRSVVLGTVLALSLAVTFLLMVSMPTAYATTPTTVTGKFYSKAFTNIEGRQAGESDNAIVTLSVTALWTGDIAGISTSESRWIWHNYVPPYGGGPINAHGVNTMASAAVKIDGVTYSGSLTMLFLGVMEGFTSEMEGTWVIISGTDGLANLNGQGTWYHALGMVGSDYTGQVHFDP
jgi:hypothetical protein